MPEVRDRDAIETFLRRQPSLHLYELGDLDPFFWPLTRWWGLAGPAGDLTHLAMLYAGGDSPTLLALDGELPPALVADLDGALPDRVYAHLAPGGVDRLPAWRADHHGLHYKMTLVDPVRLEGHADGDVVVLDAGDLEDLEALYRRSYPGNWFDPRMLETGHYAGVRRDGELVCVAGVHVFSPVYRVAALGNITTAPDMRGRGLATRVTAALCRRLLATGRVDTIGLNVHGDNAVARACYRSLGFAVTARYHEYTLERRTT